MQATGARLVKYGGGTTFAMVPKAFQDTLTVASAAVETKYPKITEARIQGSVPHQSKKDTSDEKKVITVSYHTKSGTRVCSIHAHDDNTWNEFPSRNVGAGK